MENNRCHLQNSPCGKCLNKLWPLIKNLSLNQNQGKLFPHPQSPQPLPLRDLLHFPSAQKRNRISPSLRDLSENSSEENSDDSWTTNHTLRKKTEGERNNVLSITWQHLPTTFKYTPHTVPAKHKKKGRGSVDFAGVVRQAHLQGEALGCFPVIDPSIEGKAQWEPLPFNYLKK